ncbi:MAG: hypothetical protein R2865_14740 [Deinococcales bacterium]
MEDYAFDVELVNHMLDEAAIKIATRTGEPRNVADGVSRFRA